MANGPGGEANLIGRGTSRPRREAQISSQRGPTDQSVQVSPGLVGLRVLSTSPEGEAAGWSGSGSVDPDEEPSRDSRLLGTARCSGCVGKLPGSQRRPPISCTAGSAGATTKGAAQGTAERGEGSAPALFGMWNQLWSASIGARARTSGGPGSVRMVRSTSLDGMWNCCTPGEAPPAGTGRSQPGRCCPCSGNHVAVGKAPPAGAGGEGGGSGALGGGTLTGEAPPVGAGGAGGHPGVLMAVGGPRSTEDSPKLGDANDRAAVRGLPAGDSARRPVNQLDGD